MANVYNYTFNSLSRIGNDTCGISEKDMMNETYGSYPLKNYQ